MKQAVLSFGTLLLLLGSAFLLVGCQSMSDPYGSDIPNDPRSWELTPGMTGVIGN